MCTIRNLLIISMLNRGLCALLFVCQINCLSACAYLQMGGGREGIIGGWVDEWVGRYMETIDGYIKVVSV